MIEFLKTLQVLPPGTKDRIVDDTFKPRDVAAGPRAGHDHTRMGAPVMNGLALIALVAQLATPRRQRRRRAVEIVLFSDFHCPFCAQLAAPIPRAPDDAAATAS